MQRVLLRLFLVAAVFTTSSLPATAADTGHPFAGSPTQVLTLGSVHLSQLKVKIEPRILSAVLAKLAAFQPDFITVEGVGGEQCDHLQRYGDLYSGSYDAWCSAPTVAQHALGINGPQAAARVQKMLSSWPAVPKPAQRRRLAATFLAAGERPSARVQWLRLPLAERRAGDGVIAAMLPVLNRTTAKMNETYEVAAVLAATLHLERVYCIDDHTSDEALPDEGKGYADAIEAAWKRAPSPAAPTERRLERALRRPDDVLRLYRFLNEPQTLREDTAADFGAALRDPSEGRYGRQYVAAWHVRNLRMVSNIVAVFASHPGSRVLNVVGSAHKPYFDAYLRHVPDVRIINTEDILR